MCKRPATWGNGIGEHFVALESSHSGILESVNIHDSGPDSYPGQANIDLGAISHNLLRLRQAAPGCKQMVIVKADAYGHSRLPVALAAIRSGAEYLGVAHVEEALTLRDALDEAGVAREAVTIFSWISPSGLDWTRPLRAGLELSVSAPWTLRQICEAARATGIVARIHVKIDTGMSRAGAT
ncbi:MAG: hypothetical protein CSA82_03030, partial [Actinobacteria bacterium]